MRERKVYLQKDRARIISGNILFVEKFNEESFQSILGIDKATQLIKYSGIHFITDRNRSKFDLINRFFSGL